MDASKAQKINLPSIKYLKDYQPSNFLVHNVNLIFDLDDNETIVENQMTISRNDLDSANSSDDLVLCGRSLKLISISINGVIIESQHYHLNQQLLIIPEFSRFLQNGFARVTIVTATDPENNTSLSGLYKSSENFCTQCEAEGFRKITYFIDRPDIMAVYTVVINADKDKYPILLSNGNLIKFSEIDAQRHSATWHDPHPKPSYLFALVAGDFAKIEDSFTTMNSRHVDLIIYSEHHNIHQCQFAMDSLKRSMKWDEEYYGREYDLDLYMIVAIDDFNAGAMENKGLNIFNTKYVLASPDTATDGDYIGVESVIAHEYFHNWSGNRITCRDWFQLSLKEGFTVFRDQCFTATLHSQGVKRIEDVNILRSHQFKEDAGPMAHPIRPSSYQEINNFYTVTVYNKGAEVVRMIHTLLGEETFRGACDIYFERYDNQAVTCEDFIHAMQTAANKDNLNIDFAQFQNWYKQAGTPKVIVTEQYNQADKSLVLNFRQENENTAYEKSLEKELDISIQKEPFLIPIKYSVFDKDGKPILNSQPDNIFILDKDEQSLVLEDIDMPVYVSLLRDFSAPIYLKRKLDYSYLSFLARYDDDEFNRWDALQSIYAETIMSLMNDFEDVTQCTYQDVKKKCQHIQPLIKELLLDTTTNGLLLDMFLTVPSVSYLSELVDIIRPKQIFYARKYLIRYIATENKEIILERYQQLRQGSKAYSIDADDIAQRALKNKLLNFIACWDDEESHQICKQQLENADNLTDRIAALSNIVNSSNAEREAFIASFYENWKQYPLVMDKWLAIQAVSSHENTLANVENLTKHAVFNAKNPNKVYSLIRSFINNALHFHNEDGSGYQFIAQWIIYLNAINPQVAARVASAFNGWQRYTPELQEKMYHALQQIHEQENLSDNVSEIVNKALG